MRQSLAAVVFVCAALTAGADDEKKYASEDGKYAVQFPAGAKVKTDKQDAGGGLSINMATAEAGGRAYAVMYTVLPDAATEIPAKTILDGAEKGAVDKSGGKLVQSKDMTVGKDKHPGRDVLVEKDGNKVRTWVVIAGTRVYVVVVGGPKEFATEKEATAFLDSFEITK